MVTAKEYRDSLDNPISISLCEERYAASSAELVYNGNEPELSKGDILDKKASKIADLAFWRWLKESSIMPAESRSVFLLCEADNIAVCGRRIEVRADVRTWQEALAMPLRHFGLRVPVERLHGSAGAADYYVYCLIDPEFSKASLIGYYEGYAVLAHEVRTGVVQKCVAMPVSWLHPMGDLSLILRAGCAANDEFCQDEADSIRPVMEVTAR